MEVSKIDDGEHRSRNGWTFSKNIIAFRFVKTGRTRLSQERKATIVLQTMLSSPSIINSLPFTQGESPL